MLFFFGLKVMLIGMLIVFFELIILIGIINLAGAILRRSGKKKEAPVLQQAPTPAPVPVAGVSIDGSGDELSLVAVLTATLLAAEGSKDGKRMVVRSIRKFCA
ncbi:MAG: OadG family protein [Candidatus Excrementavichristensenella sp.]|jgi:sodium pump decarboxylase gamma subunit